MRHGIIPVKKNLHYICMSSFENVEDDHGTIDDETRLKFLSRLPVEDLNYLNSTYGKPYELEVRSTGMIVVDFHGFISLHCYPHLLRFALGSDVAGP